MNPDSHHHWMSRFLEEVGLPLRAEFLGYVLYNHQQKAFIAIDTLGKDAPHQPLVKPCAWAHCYPCIMEASDAASLLPAEYAIRALFQLDGGYVSHPV